jgi:glucose-6-phosphate isomerase
MLSLDITGTFAKSITPNFGIPDQEFIGMRTLMKKNIEDWLKEREQGEHGWSMNPYDRQMVQKVKEVTMLLKDRGIRTVLWVGIGGSGLGPRVLQEVFETPEGAEFIVVDTIDPSILQMYLTLLDWRSTLVVVVSKSGDTLETMSAFHLFYEHIRRQRKAKVEERVVAITDPEKGHLRSFCMERGIPMLPLPPNVGGRYSIFTPVGLFALALLGGDINAFMRGAKEMDTLCQKPRLEENPAALLASVQYLLDVKKSNSVRVIMPYSTRLMSIARWNQQLIAESLGKTETDNPIPLAAIGTQDQHSLLQQWMAGPRKSWHIFIRELETPKVVVPLSVEQAFPHLAGKSFGKGKMLQI